MHNSLQINKTLFQTAEDGLSGGEGRGEEALLKTSELLQLNQSSCLGSYKDTCHLYQPNAFHPRYPTSSTLQPA